MNPSPAIIAKRLAAIRSTWDENTHRTRAGLPKHGEYVLPDIPDPTHTSARITSIPEDDETRDND